MTEQPSDQLTDQLTEQLTRLQQLEVQLHEVNEELARAALPLEGASDLSDDQRRQIGARIREGLARWEDVTRQISQVFRTGDSTGP